MGTGDFSNEDWEEFLEERLGAKMLVTYGRSRTAPVQARPLRSSATGAGRAGKRGATPTLPPGWEIRLHSIFAEAPPDVREAFAKWLEVGRRARRASDVLDAWIHEALADVPRARRSITLRPRGLVHDLGAFADELFATEFSGDFEDSPGTDANAPERPLITWGRRGKSRSRRGLRLGSFDPETRVVRVHTVLDQAAVPEWFVRFVLSHEILHAVIEAHRDPSGRWVHHSAAFRRREASWPEYAPAVEWEQRNVNRLIRSAREGTALRVLPRELEVPATLRDRPQRPARIESARSTRKAKTSGRGVAHPTLFPLD